MKQYTFPVFITISGLLFVYLVYLAFASFFPNMFAPEKDRSVENPTAREQVQSKNTPDTNPQTSDTKDTSVCTREYAPVCGIDGNTYVNDCVATSENIAIDYEGECKISTVSGELSEEPKESDFDVERTEVGSLSLYDTGSYHHYKNTYLQYSFALPKYTWYQGYGARDGAVHTMAVGLSGSGVATFDGAEVQIFLFRKTPANPPSDDSVSIENGIVYLTAKDPSNPKIKKILDTVKESVE